MNNNNDDGNQNKTDWSLASSIWNSEESPKTVRDQVIRSVNKGELVPSKVTMPPTSNLAKPEFNESLGVMAKWKEKKLSRKATLKALEAHYDSQLDALTYSLAEAVRVQKAHAHVIAEQYLKELDARQIEMLTDLGLRNKDTREQALIKLTDMTSARVKEVTEKDWMPELIQDTIQELLKLRKRVMSEIMTELGGDNSDE